MMRVRLFEWKKLLFYHKGAYIILVYLAGMLLFLLLTDTPRDYRIERNRKSYESYLNQTVGKIDEDTVSFLNGISLDFSHAESEIQTIYKEFSEGGIPEEKYREKLFSLEKEMQEKQGFMALYDQYSYAREDTERRYLLNTNAWNALLSDDSLNIPLILAIMILALLIFGTEYTCEMDILLKISVNGERNIARKKITMMLLISGSLSILDYLERILYFHFRYGFTHGKYPLQSLSYFSEYTKDCTLSEAMLLTLVWKLLGALLWGTIVSIMIVLTKKYSLTMLFGVSGVMLIHYGIPNSYIKYFLPGPVGPMIGTGYFRGSSYFYDESTQKNIIEFLQVSEKAKDWIIVMDVVLIVFFSRMILSCYTNCWNKSKAGIKVRLFAAVLLSAVCMGGCGQNNAAGDTIFNMDQRYNFENEEYLVYVDSAEDKIWVQDKITGEKEAFIKDAFSEGKNIYPFFYGTSNYVYYMELTYAYEEQVLSSEYDKFEIMRIDLRDFSSKIIYRDNASTRNQTLLGLSSNENDFLDMYLGTTAFFVNDSNIYFVTSSEVWSVNVRSGKRKLLFYQCGRSVSYDGKGFYYLDDMFKLMRYDLKTEVSLWVEQIVASSFVLTEDGIVYADLEQSEGLVSLNRKNKKKTLLLPKSTLCFTSDGKRVFYIESFDSTIYEINLAGKEKKKLGDTLSGMIYAFTDYGEIYIPDMTGGKMGILEK